MSRINIRMFGGGASRGGKQTAGGVLLRLPSAASDEVRKAVASEDQEPEPPDFDDDDVAGPEDALKPIVVQAWASWVAAHRDPKAKVEPAWAKPEDNETAANFAVRAAGELAKMPEAAEAIASVGEGWDWVDWVTAVMRYEGQGAGSAVEVAKSLAATGLFDPSEVEKSSKSIGRNDELTADEAKAVQTMRLNQYGANWAKFRATGDETNNYWPDFTRTCAPEEYAEQQAQDEVVGLTWDGGSRVRLMRSLGGIEKFHAWAIARVMDGIRSVLADDAAPVPPRPNPNGGDITAIPNTAH